MKPLFIRPEAQADVFEAALWYEAHQAELGFAFDAKIRETYDRIAANPRQFPVQRRGTRRALVGRFPYAVYFKEREAELVVIAVLHLHRDPQTWYRR